MQYYRDEGLGDVLMCTPTLRQLKRDHPEYEITFYTNYVTLVEGLPYIDHVYHADLCAPGGAHWMGYESAQPSALHLAKLIGASVGVALEDVTPDCVIDAKFVEEYRQLWSHLPRPHILIQQTSGQWTPNKNWPRQHWVELIDAIVAFGSVVEVSAPILPQPLYDSDRYLDLKGETTVSQLAACVAACDIFIGPDSGPAHIAAAVKKPAIVIHSGYSNPTNEAYSTSSILSAIEPCAPCSLRTPCPHRLPCLTRISPGDVFREIMAIWAGIPATRGGREEP